MEVSIIFACFTSVCIGKPEKKKIVEEKAAGDVLSHSKWNFLKIGAPDNVLQGLRGKDGGGVGEGGSCWSRILLGKSSLELQSCSCL